MGWKTVAVSIALTAIGWGIGSCGKPPAVEHPSPLERQIAAAQQAVRQHPDDADVVCELGVLYYRAGEYRRALSVLEKALQRHPEHARALCFLGLCHEALGEADLAMATYLRYLQLPEEAPLRPWLQGRLQHVNRIRQQEQARGRFNRRAELDSATLHAGRLVLTPLSFHGEDPRYAHLGQSIGEYLQVVLPQCESIEVEDDLNVRTIFQELAKRPELLENEQNSTILLGKICNARYVIRGGYAVLNGQLVIDLAVWDVTTREIPRARTLADSISRLAAMQQNLAAGILQKIGRTCAGEKLQPLSRDLPALLAMGAGLAALEQEDFSAAVSHFEAALKQDDRCEHCRTLLATARLLAIAGEDPDRLQPPE